MDLEWLAFKLCHPVRSTVITLFIDEKERSTIAVDNVLVLPQCEAQERDLLNFLGSRPASFYQDVHVFVVL